MPDADVSPSEGHGWPIDLRDVENARARSSAYLRPTAVGEYGVLNQFVGSGIEVFVKHENHQPTNSFKVRNALAAMSALSVEERDRGVIAASRGNHGLGLAYAGRRMKIVVTDCVPLGNNPGKNAAMRGLGAELVESGADYDDAASLAAELAIVHSLTIVHATNNRDVLAVAGTIALELLEQAPELDAIVVPVGGGSVAVGAMTVFRALHPATRVYGVQAAGAATTVESWKVGRPVQSAYPNTFADGIATRGPYAMTYDALKAGLTGFVTVSDAAIAEAVRVLRRSTHNLVEGAGAASLAGLRQLREELAGQRVAVVLTGSNIDYNTLVQVLVGDL